MDSLSLSSATTLVAPSVRDLTLSIRADSPSPADQDATLDTPIPKVSIDDDRPYWYRASKSFTNSTIARHSHTIRNSDATTVASDFSRSPAPTLESESTAFSVLSTLSEEKQKELSAYVYQPLSQLINRLVYVALVGGDSGKTRACSMAFDFFLTF
jgi:hypothetical protein